MDVVAQRRVLAGIATVGWSLSFVLLEGQSIYEPLGFFALGILVLAVLIDREGLAADLTPTTRGVGLGLATGLLLTLVTYALFPLLAHLPWVPEQLHAVFSRMRVGAESGVALPLTAFILAVEEIVWRGILTRPGTLGPVGPWAAWGLSAGIYGVAQLGSGSPVLVAIAFGFGLLWGLVRHLSGELWAPILCHLVWDSCILFALPPDRLFPGVLGG